MMERLMSTIQKTGEKNQDTGKIQWTLKGAKVRLITREKKNKKTTKGWKKNKGRIT